MGGWVVGNYVLDSGERFTCRIPGDPEIREKVLRYVALHRGIEDGDDEELLRMVIVWMSCTDYPSYRWAVPDVPRPLFEKIMEDFGRAAEAYLATGGVS